MSHQMTPEGYEALKAELAELEGPARREIAERIKTAREWGDLKENSEYHDAKNDQAFLETKIKRLAERLRNAEVVERGAGDGAVQVGSRVELRDEASGRTVSYELVGATEADLAAGRLSVASPLAQAVLGRREGDVVVVSAPRGEMRYTVVAVA
ncbi:MAG TPA: transcription elongation factor GreA [Solirubrobacteraceae bacterium]